MNITHIDKPLPYKKIDRRMPDISANYREACVNGADHPLAGEDFIYELVEVGAARVDASIIRTAAMNPPTGKYTEEEMVFIAKFTEAPEIDWAINNSFDGLYIKREPDHITYHMIYKFYVYMESSQATFWRLKFS